MEKVSVKTKLIILIVLICGCILLINNYSEAAWYTRVTGIKLNSYKRNLWLNGSGYVQLKATIYPSDAGNKKVKWSSSNTNVAIVDNMRNSKR